MAIVRLLRIGLFLVLVLGLLLPTSSPRLRAQAPDIDDLARGLVATVTDGTTIHRLEPTVAVALKAGEAPHPRLGSAGGKYEWKGYVNLLRAGKYRFSAQLRGAVTVRVGDATVLHAEAKDDAATLKEGAEVELPAGVSPIRVEYQRPAGVARLELLWQGPGFRREPLPHDVLGHLPPKGADPVAAQSVEDRGRFLFEEHSCVKCHAADDGLKVAGTLGHRAGPDLSKIGGRVHAGWIDRWLESPQALQPHAVMPAVFATDDAGKAERHAVAAYLASLGKLNENPAPKDAPQRQAKGEKLFHSVGCVTCHGPYPATEPAKADAAPYPLTGLGSKTTPEKLAEFLANPLASHPAGRMPNLLLTPEEARDLAFFLTASTVPNLAKTLPAAPAEEALKAAFGRVDPRADELTAWEKLPAGQRLVELGKRSVIARGCNNCHKIEPDGKPFASVMADDLSEIAAPAKHKSGCLADVPPADGKVPRFALAAADRQALRAFLATGLDGAGTPAPAFHARVALQRFNCLACHNREGAGGLTTALIETLRKYEKVEQAEALLPPTLTGVGHKLRTSALKGALTQAVRVRPWMGLRMPQFGEANVGHLADGLAALEGTTPDDGVHKVELTSARLAAGRDLAGKGAFGCASCHDMAGVPNTGTRGPDLALTPQRVRYDWYQRWLEQPQRMEPGTRMPAVFANGKSLVDHILDGRVDSQAEAMWAYFSLGNNMPLPEGMEPPKGLTVAVQDRPVVIRTFLPDAGSRGLAIGYPGGVAVAYDAQAARLAFAWSGNFLDASPVWAGRGGNPAKILGARFWSSPAGCPVGVSDGDEPPDFALRAKDPAYGANPPADAAFQGQPLLRFGGYATDKAGVPTFRYEVDGAGTTVRVAETIRAERAPAGLGVRRTFALEVPKGRTLWILLAESANEPQRVDGGGAVGKLDLAGGKAELPGDAALLVPVDGEKAHLLRVASPEAKYRVQKVGATWQVLVRVPGAGTVDVRTWQPYRAEAALLKDLVATK